MLLKESETDVEADNPSDREHGQPSGHRSTRPSGRRLMRFQMPSRASNPRPTRQTPCTGAERNPRAWTTSSWAARAAAQTDFKPVRYVQQKQCARDRAASSHVLRTCCRSQENAPRDDYVDHKRLEKAYEVDLTAVLTNRAAMMCGRRAWPLRAAAFRFARCRRFRLRSS